MASAANENPPVLRAKARDVRTLASLLRPIGFSKTCQVLVSEPGLQIVTDMNSVLQASAYIGRGLFDEFEYNPEPSDLSQVDEDEDDVPVSTFDVSLANWLACLNIYGTATGSGTPSDRDAAAKAGQQTSNFEAARSKAPFARGRTSVELTYAGLGSPLVLDIREAKVVTRCEIATYELDTTLIGDMPFLSERTVGQVIMHSKTLTEALMSIDPTSRTVTFAFLDDAPAANNDDALPKTPRRNRGAYASQIAMAADGDEDDVLDTRAIHRKQVGSGMMRISAIGDSGSTELDFPNRNKVFESFSIQYPSKHSYLYANIQHLLRALQTSIKTSIRIDDQGMMSMQCLFPDRPIALRGDGTAINNNDEVAGPEKRGFVEIRLLAALNDDEL